jgi:glycolate dehydrogenase FAD-binding subunit
MSNVNNDISQQLQQQIAQAYSANSPLSICAGGSKDFYGRKIQGDNIDVTRHSGIISYEPTELVITARAGTPLSEIENTLDEKGQMLGFEPPHFSDSATLGGTIACNLSGPRRPYCGAARDYVLGSNIINGKAEKLHFGGEVMKNVAGYDVSRLMCGSMGTLGLLLDVSLKVIPKPEAESTVALECDVQTAIDKMHQWMQQSLPLSASSYVDGKLYVRLASNEASIKAAHQTMGGELFKNIEYWHQLKEQQHPFFDTELPIWRLSLASNAAPLNLQGDTLYDWGGALRWLRSNESADKIRHAVEALGGHATLFKNNVNQLDPFHELSPGIHTMHRQLRLAFDPANILNPGRMYADI